MKLIYVGRLDKEKGIDALLYATQKLLTNKIKFSLHIFGTWYYTDDITQLALEYPQKIYFHGWVPKKDITTLRKTMDYFLMPSSFLETFGLTACESLHCSVPVIGNKKWGLLPFIHDTLDIQSYPWSHDGQKLYSLLHHLIQHRIYKESFTSWIKNIQTIYTTDQWKKSFITHLSGKSILLISDFINYNGWGIETHIHDAITLLHQENISTKLYGHTAPTWTWAVGKKIFLMAISRANIYDGYMIYRYSQKYKTIRRHSISRIIWWLPIFLSKSPYQIITHHELWLFHPFPSKVTDPQQLPRPRSLYSFIQAGQTTNPFLIIGIIGKYILIYLIHKQLKNKVKTHIVPSEWMVAVIKGRHPEAEIYCIPHFILF